MKCVIVDDEPLALDLLESYVRKTPFLELTGKYSSAVQAMKELNGRPVDLIFLDIQMPELNGLEFSKILPPDTRIVFTTAFDQYALDGYKVNALDYLLKPISYVDFLRAADKALHWFERVQSARPREEEIDSIFVKSEYKLVQIELRNILYVEGLKDYIKIYEEDSPKPVLSLMSMKAMEDLLPASQFIRVHRSYIVRKDKIRIIDRGRIVFGKTYIPISDSYKQTFQEYLDRRRVEDDTPGRLSRNGPDAIAGKKKRVCPIKQAYPFSCSPDGQAICPPAITRSGSLRDYIRNLQS